MYCKDCIYYDDSYKPEICYHKSNLICFEKGGCDQKDNEKVSKNIGGFCNLGIKK